MKNSEIKEKIKEALELDSPSLRSKVLASCQSEAQLPAESETVVAKERVQGTPRVAIYRRIAALAACIALFISGLSVGLFIPRGDGGASNGVTVGAAETFVYLDVNPSIEMQMDGEGRVVECLAANEDAEQILSGLELSGVNMSTAISAIVGSMYVNGYLTEESNSILVSVNGEDGEKTERLLSDITAKINEVFEKSELECSIIAQSVKVDEALKERAEQNGVSVGKMHLVDKMVEVMEELGAENATELANMSIKELNLIYSTKPEKDDGENSDPFGKDVSSGTVGGYVDKEDALGILLEAMEKDLSSVEWYSVHVMPHKTGGGLQLAYSVYLRFAGDATVYEYTLDCLTGEILQTNEDVFGDLFPDNNGEESVPDSSHGGESEGAGDDEHGHGSHDYGDHASKP
ncbi:MAG: hypothetical protein IJX97_00310 [Clostridia bacterium]|nr:hypothetical protein [Clostridia bacterium]